MNEILENIIEFAVNIFVVAFAHGGQMSAVLGIFSFLFSTLIFTMVAITGIVIIRRNRFGDHVAKPTKVLLGVQALVFSYFVAGISAKILNEIYGISILWTFLLLFVAISWLLIFMIRRLSPRYRSTTEPNTEAD